MFKHVTHADGVVSEDEILFSTSFGYMFPEAARSAPCCLPQTEVTLAGLRALGRAMAGTGPTGSPVSDSPDSEIQAAFTYLGQFIDHDITARTDRESSVTSIGKGDPVLPRDPDEVVGTLRNGRRPQLDLDSVFGEGPGLAPGARTQSQALYENDLTLRIFKAPGRLDLKRTKTVDLDGKESFPALVSDMRNDENLNISQLQVAFLTFFNAVHAAQAGTDKERYVRARQLVRWAYQFVVLNEYLPTVCDPDVVRETRANGPRFAGPTAGHGDAFMPLEFSVSAFRFGHSMIRSSYALSSTSGDIPLIAADPDANIALLGTNSRKANFEADGQLKQELMIEWANFVGPTAQKARKIDTKIAHDLSSLPFRPDDPVLSNLAQSNLFRGYSLRVPTGQAVCDLMGVDPMKPGDILATEDAQIAAVLKDAYFHHRTPLWYYVLREAAVQQDGERLGEVGSRLVAETIVSLVKQDPNSYLSNRHDSAVKADGIRIRPGAGGLVRDLTSLLTFAGFTGL